MEGKELIFETLRHNEVERAPWVPYAGVHAGKLINKSAKEILTDVNLMYEALMEVNKIYKPDGQPVLFDLQIEAEAMGCELLWAEKAPPSVITHPLSENPEVPCDCTIPTEEDGRIPFALEVMRMLKESVGDFTALYGLTTGPLTLASHLRGTNVFKDMRRNPEYARDLFRYCTDVNIAMAKYYIDAGMDVIGVVDPVISQISAKHFEELLSEEYTRLFDYIRSRGVFNSFFVCGDATRNIEVMCKTNPDSIAVDENVDIVAAKRITDQYNIVLGGNIPLTTIMLFGNQQDNMKFVVDMIDKLKAENLDVHKNFIVAPGCDMPFDTPIANTIATAQAVFDTDGCRALVKDYEAVDDDIEVEIPDYENLEKPLIEVFTLDSAQCAACTYMMKAAYDAEEEFGDKITVVEYKNTERDGMIQAKAMKVVNLPSLYINGELKYSSIIPDEKEFFDEISKLL